MSDLQKAESPLTRLWHAWKRFGQILGDLIARIVLTVFYFTIFLPFGLGVRLFADPLDIQRKGAAWKMRTTQVRTLKDARRLA